MNNKEYHVQLETTVGAATENTLSTVLRWPPVSTALSARYRDEHRRLQRTAFEFQQPAHGYTPPTALQHVAVHPLPAAPAI